MHACRSTLEDPTELLGLPPGWLVPGVDHLGKSLVDLPTAFGEQGAAPVALQAVVAPQVAARAGVPVPLRAAGVVAALAPSTILQTPGDASGSLGLIAEVARALPAWTVDVGADVAASGPTSLLQVLGKLVAP